MRTVSSYGVEIRKQNIPIRQTMEIYRQAVGYLTEIYAQVWEELRKMPSYLCRSAIQHALGSVSSYETRLGQWKETGVLSGRPKLTCRNHAMPVFYRDVMYREGAEGKDEAYLKLYDGHDWKWFRVYLKRTDMEYLPRNWKGKKTSSPASPDTRTRSHLHGFSSAYLTIAPAIFLPSSVFRRFVYAHLPCVCAEPCSLWNLRIRPSARYIRSFSLG